MISIDRQFIERLGNSRLHLVDKGDGKFNVRCPLCGDSKRNKHKIRGYFIPRREIDQYIYFCHNCGESITLSTFLSRFDESLFKEYCFAQFIDKDADPTIPDAQTNQIDCTKWLKQLRTVSQLQSTHPIYQYCVKRRIPLDRVWAVDDLVAWAVQFAPEQFAKQVSEIKQQSIVFPLATKSRLFGFQARAIDSTHARTRFLTLLVDRSQFAIYGLDTVDFNQRYYCTEGVIDALHLPNSIAVLTNQIPSTLKQLSVPVDKAVVCLDNERLNKDTVKQYHRAIRDGYHTLIWPSNVTVKDFNELATINGLSNQQIKDLVDCNTFVGLQAQLAIADWLKG